jgi:hypothetical protein
VWLLFWGTKDIFIYIYISKKVKELKENADARMRDSWFYNQVPVRLRRVRTTRVDTVIRR